MFNNKWKQNITKNSATSVNNGDGYFFVNPE